MQRLGAVALVLGLGLGCEKTLAIEVDVLFPADVQNAIPLAEYPLQVAFQTDLHDGESETFCEPMDTDATLTLTGETLGCAEPTEVRVIVGNWEEPSTGCVIEPGNGYSFVQSTGVLASGTAMAYEDADTTLCSGAEETVEVTLSTGAL